MVKKENAARTMSQFFIYKTTVVIERKKSKIKIEAKNTSNKKQASKNATEFIGHNYMTITLLG